jgi:hypothetical protein
MSQFWDARFGNKEYIYGKKPNAFFQAELEKLEPGKVLLPADGEGRNGVYAARNGWEVYAFDTSKEGRKKAMALAEELDVTLHYELESYQTYDPKGKKFEVIALIFAHKPSEMRRYFHSKMLDWLAPDGVVILEAFHKTQLGNNSGGPKDLDLLYSIEDLKDDFKNLDIQLLEQKEVDLDEGGHHQGKAQVVRMVARKSNSM